MSAEREARTRAPEFCATTSLFLAAVILTTQTWEIMLLSRDNEYRYITILGLIQTVAVIFGVLAVYAITKPLADHYSMSEFPRATRIVRSWGLALLLIPLSWSAGSIIAQLRLSPTWLPRAMLILGTLLLFVLVYLFVGGAVAAYSLPYIVPGPQ